MGRRSSGRQIQIKEIYIIFSYPFLMSDIKNEYTTIINLRQFDADKLRKTVKGIGGMQSLLRKLQGQLYLNNKLFLTKQDIEKVKQYWHHNDKSGGYQGRLEPVAMYIEANTNSMKLNEFN